jgi:hypothetical protein
MNAAVVPSKRAGGVLQRGVGAWLSAIAATGWLAATTGSAAAQEIPTAVETEKVALDGLTAVRAFAENVSGVAVGANELVLGADEGAELQFFQRIDERRYRGGADALFTLPMEGEGEEIDIEGLAISDGVLYVVGSHSRKRKTVKPDKTAKKNLERLGRVEREPSRERLYRIELDAQGRPRADSVRSVSLIDTIKTHEVLRRFDKIPSKENGIDIEGLAVGSNGRIYVGFRGPVLRGGFATVLALKVDFEQGAVEDVQTRYISLGGRGIRAMGEVDGGANAFVILAGPVRDEPVSYVAYLWNGKSTVPGRDNPTAAANVGPLCRIPLPAAHPRAKAEGIAFLSGTDGVFRFTVVYDGAAGGAATVFECAK